MSIPRKFDVNCPKCGKSFKTTAFESINSDYEPDIAEKIISGERFNAKCPKCGNVAHLEYDVLYHDMKHGAMIWVIHKNNDDYNKKIAEVRMTNLIPYKTTRIVSDINELREKVACLETGKDDRIVELSKIALSANLMQQKPDFQCKDAFYTCLGDREVIYFYDENGHELACDFDKKIYDTIANIFSRPLYQMDNSPYKIIDSAWAENFYGLLSDDEIESASCPDDNANDNNDPSNETDEFVKGDDQEAISEQKKTDAPLFCRKCGEKLLSDSLFCSYCGTKVIR